MKKKEIVYLMVRKHQNPKAGLNKQNKQVLQIFSDQEFKVIVARIQYRMSHKWEHWSLSIYTRQRVVGESAKKANWADVTLYFSQLINTWPFVLDQKLPLETIWMFVETIDRANFCSTHDCVELGPSIVATIWKFERESTSRGQIESKETCADVNSMVDSSRSC